MQATFTSRMQLSFLQEVLSIQLNVPSQHSLQEHPANFSRPLPEEFPGRCERAAAEERRLPQMRPTGSQKPHL
jgi:hypothetical protein